MSVETNETKIAFDQSYVSDFSNQRNEPKWLTDLRLRGLELAESLPMPKPEKTKIDKWNFTQFQHIVKASEVNSADDLPEYILNLIGKEDRTENFIIQRNSTPAFRQVSQELQDKGVIFTDIATAVQEHSELVEKYFMNQAVSVDEHRLTALHAALLNGGVFVYVPKNVEIEVPLQSVFVQEDAEAALFNHVLVVAEDNSSVTYVENYLSHSDDQQSVANIVAEVYAGPNARVQFGAVDNFAKGVTTYVNRRGHVERDGKIEWSLGQMNDGNTISDNTTNLVGDGSYADTKTVSIGRGDQKQNFVIRVNQWGKQSDAQLLAHAVMKDNSSAIFNGIAKIEHGATKANSEQTERVLMLSEKARGDANPILLIDEDDVTAGHAASVGRMDPLQMFYLMSRGISKHEAERLVIHGFLAPVVNELPIEGVRKMLTEVIEGKVN
ncbi:Fe-S cluster assembly protein SufD [Pseudalkalibacillus berkeleyi]|uniref:Fe-S cluster assembly protein SufD n=1 Tax=Pseudalkalibacillus berkeleyi TaxID=1069813 RepID=A0ABS9H4G1_9BACL|nr:Fe-S cluster assembly protein SufD [Pseudalkalibacillus berkeleyi]MCF6138565.1 Fe-S cluster assembly protein SufD [Pseudalkalibacillus berkeleyi]